MLGVQLTSLADRTLDKACANNRRYAASRASYLPIFPSPASNGVQLRLTKDSRPLSKNSYVSMGDVFQVAPDALRLYNTRAFDKAEPRLEEESFRAMMKLARRQPGFVAFMDKFKAGGVSVPAKFKPGGVSFPAKLKTGGLSVPAKIPVVRPEEILAPVEVVVVRTIEAPIDVPTPEVPINAPTAEEEDADAPVPAAEPPNPRPKDSSDDGVGLGARGPGQAQMDEDEGVESIEEVPAVGGIQAHEIFGLVAFFVLLGWVVDVCFRRILELLR